jgi:hypothetical protein
MQAQRPGPRPKRQLILREQQEERRAARLTVTLDNSVSWRLPGTPRWVGMKILAVDPTDRDAALSAPTCTSPTPCQPDTR